MKVCASYSANAVRIGFFRNLANGSQHWLRSCKIEAIRFDFPLLRQAAETLSGNRVGYTTSNGVYIQNRLLVTGDCTGPSSAEFVLKDPTVNFAVLECARGGLLRAGLGFKKCDIGIVTNVAADHLGLRGIHTIEQLAKVKGVIPETVLPTGYAILNADDDLVYDMCNPKTTTE